MHAGDLVSEPSARSAVALGSGSHKSPRNKGNTNHGEMFRVGARCAFVHRQGAESSKG
jgi:hypothetical protein